MNKLLNKFEAKTSVEQKRIRAVVLGFILIYWIGYAITPTTYTSGDTFLNIVPAPIVQAPVIAQVVPEVRRETVSRGNIDRSGVATISTINSFLQNKLKNKGELIHNTCKEQTPKVSSKLMTAIILVEVGEDCDSNVLNKADNVGGLNWFEGCGYPKYSKWYINFKGHGGVDKSIEMKAQILSRYIREGRTDIKSIGLKYAPPNDSRNGIGGMDNTSWAENVTYWFNTLSKEESRRI